VEPVFGTGREIGLGTVSDRDFDAGGNPGDSARRYLEPDDPYYEYADMLYAWKIARKCDDDEPYCLESPVPPAADPPFPFQGDWAIDANPWSTINNDLIEFAQMQKLEKGQVVCADTTVVETNIPCPTDARLLWGSLRVLTRTMQRIRRQMPLFDFGFAHRTRCCKKLCYKITMVKSPKTDKKRLKLYSRLDKKSLFDFTRSNLSGEHRLYQGWTVLGKSAYECIGEFAVGINTTGRHAEPLRQFSPVDCRSREIG
jgi:hypothetical protein